MVTGRGTSRALGARSGCSCRESPEEPPVAPGPRPHLDTDNTYASRSSRSRLIRFSSRTFQASYSSSSFSSSVSSASSAASERLFSSNSFFASSSTICGKDQAQHAVVAATSPVRPLPAPRHLERVLAPLLRHPLCLLLQLLLPQGFCLPLLDGDPVLPAGRYPLSPVRSWHSRPAPSQVSSLSAPQPLSASAPCKDRLQPRDRPALPSSALPDCCSCCPRPGGVGEGKETTVVGSAQCQH